MIYIEQILEITSHKAAAAVNHQPPISKTIQIRRTRHAGHRRRNEDELRSDIIHRIPSHKRVGVGHPAKTFL